MTQEKEEKKWYNSKELPKTKKIIEKKHPEIELMFLEGNKK